MQIDLQTISIKPLRQTFDHLAARFGDKPASRYQEGTYDIQQTYLFHYKPTWDPDRDIFDVRRTAIRMKDWYDFKDPRQFYYGTYTIARAKQQEAADAAFEFAFDGGLAEAMSPAARKLVFEILLPMRHVEWGGNMNNTFISAYGYGTAIEAACSYHAMDRLGIAQAISRIGLALDGEAALDAAKHAWLSMAEWQSLRRYVEESFVIRDWFELYVAQNLVLDAVLYDFLYTHVESQAAKEGSAFFGLVTKFMKDWGMETSRWIDAIVKAAVGESAANKVLVQGWIDQYHGQTLTALEPIANLVFGTGAAAVLDVMQSDFRSRLKKIGI